MDHLTMGMSNDKALPEDSENLQAIDEQVDAYIKLIEKTDDLEVLDEIHAKLNLELEQKYKTLKTIQKKNADMKYILNMDKDYASGIDKIQMEEQNKMDELREKIEAKRAELEHLHEQQVEDLVEFENDIQKISEILSKSPREYAHTNLLQTTSELKKYLEEKKNEMAQYKNEMKMLEIKAKQGYGDCFTGVSVKVFEESLNDINILNEKMTNSLTQLTWKVNDLQFMMGNLSTCDESVINL